MWCSWTHCAKTTISYIVSFGDFYVYICTVFIFSSVTNYLFAQDLTFAVPNYISKIEAEWELISHSFQMMILITIITSNDFDDGFFFFFSKNEC